MTAGGPPQRRRPFDRITFGAAWVLLVVIAALTIFVVWLVLREYTAPLLGALLILFQVWLFFRHRELREEIRKLRESVAALERARGEPASADAKEPGSIYK